MSMIRSSIGRRTSDGTAGAAALEILAGARGLNIRAITVTLAAATASSFGLGRPAAKGITPTTPVASLLEDGSLSDTVLTQTAIAWGTGPTVPAQFLRRFGFPNVIGSYVHYNFTSLYLPPNASLVLWNIGTNGIADVTIVCDEPKSAL